MFALFVSSVLQFRTLFQANLLCSGKRTRYWAVSGHWDTQRGKRQICLTINLFVPMWKNKTTFTISQARQIPGVTIFRSSSTVYFANAELYLEALKEKVCFFSFFYCFNILNKSLFTLFKRWIIYSNNQCLYIHYLFLYSVRVGSISVKW